MERTTAPWVTIRCYDPAINDDLILDDGGQPIPKIDPDTGEPQTNDRGDPVYQRVTDIADFVRNRGDMSRIIYRDGMEPVRFTLQPLSRTEMREYVDRAEDDDEKYRRAFDLACVRITGMRDEVGHKIADIVPARETRGLKKITAKALDELWEMGLSDIDFREIGAAAYWRAQAPKGFEPSWQVPLSSLTGLAMKARDSHRAAARRTSSSANAAATSGSPVPSTPASEPSTGAPGTAPASPSSTT